MADTRDERGLAYWMEVCDLCQAPAFAPFVLPFVPSMHMLLECAERGEVFTKLTAFTTILRGFDARTHDQTWPQFGSRFLHAMLKPIFEQCCAQAAVRVSREIKRVASGRALGGGRVREITEVNVGDVDKHGCWRLASDVPLRLNLSGKNAGVARIPQKYALRHKNMIPGLARVNVCSYQNKFMCTPMLDTMDNTVWDLEVLKTFYCPEQLAHGILQEQPALKEEIARFKAAYIPITSIDISAPRVHVLSNGLADLPDVRTIRFKTKAPVAMERFSMQFCGSLTTVQAVAGYNSLSPSAFGGCRKLKTITGAVFKYVAPLSSGGYNPFNIGIDVVTAPDMEAAHGSCLTEQSQHLNLGYAGRSDLFGVQFSAMVATVPPGALRDCRNLAFVLLPAYAQKLGKNALAGCGLLADVVVPGSAVRISSFGHEMNGLKRVMVFPHHAATLAANAADRKAAMAARLASNRALTGNIPKQYHATMTGYQHPINDADYAPFRMPQLIGTYRPEWKAIATHAVEFYGPDEVYEDLKARGMDTLVRVADRDKHADVLRQTYFWNRAAHALHANKRKPFAPLARPQLDAVACVMCCMRRLRASASAAGMPPELVETVLTCMPLHKLGRW